MSERKLITYQCFRVRRRKSFTSQFGYRLMSGPKDFELFRGSQGKSEFLDSPKITKSKYSKEWVTVTPTSNPFKIRSRSDVVFSIRIASIRHFGIGAFQTPNKTGEAFGEKSPFWTGSIILIVLTTIASSATQLISQVPAQGCYTVGASEARGQTFPQRYYYEVTKDIGADGHPMYLVGRAS